jgi:hypothetical protein
MDKSEICEVMDVYYVDYREWVKNVAPELVGKNREEIERILLRHIEADGVAKMYLIRWLLVWYKLWLKWRINVIRVELERVDGKEHPMYKFKLRREMAVLSMVRQDIKTILNVGRMAKMITKENWMVWDMSGKWKRKLSLLVEKLRTVKSEIHINLGEDL